MKFRFDDEARSGYENAESYLTSHLPPTQRNTSRALLKTLVAEQELGPVVGSYPTWHPLVWFQDLPTCPSGRPQDCGYRGVDHTVYFANGFITCPYAGGRGVLESAGQMRPPGADISVTKLGFPLYNEIATPILVRCQWRKPLAPDGTIPSTIAIPLMVLQEVRYWEQAQFGESWEDMRPYLLGSPRGARSSLFVNQTTGQAIKDVYVAIIAAGALGPIKP